MQSTGQTSTQERSFTLMHGSAMIYGMATPGNPRPADEGGPNRKHRNGVTPVKPHAGPRAASPRNDGSRDPRQQRQEGHEETVFEERRLIGLLGRRGETGARDRGDAEQQQQALSRREPHQGDDAGREPALQPG